MAPTAAQHHVIYNCGYHPTLIYIARLQPSSFVKREQNTQWIGSESIVAKFITAFRVT